MPRPLSGPSWQWTPRQRDYYARQAGARQGEAGNQRGAWQGSWRSAFAGLGLHGADAETKLDSLVASVTHSFREHGTRAGMQEARKLGMTDGARLYVEIRAETEEQLSARLARIRADLHARPGNDAAMLARAFVEVRLREVRAAVKNGATPPQAVADRPEIPRSEVPRWVPYGAFAIGLIALLRSLGR